MCKRIITLGIYVLIAFFCLAVYAPQEQAAAAPSMGTGTIAYVIPNDTTGDEIWLIQADRSNDHRIYSTGRPDPYGSVYAIYNVAWRPDGGELVFSSDHEKTCSWFASDLYAIRADGSGYRRITNAPACAALANYPKGTVTMAIGAGTGYQVYVQGAPGLLSASSGFVTFTNVADLGDKGQPVVVINGQYRYMTNGFVNVTAGQTVDAGFISTASEGSTDFAAYGPAWKRDGSRLGYAFGCAGLYGIADQPPAGDSGQPLFNSSGVTPCQMAWGTTASTANEIVYYNNTGNKGFYLTTEGSASAGTQLISVDYPFVNFVFKIQYLPDASGFIFSIVDNYAHSSNLFRYDLASGDVTRLTFYADQYARDFSISPDGQSIVYELAAYNYMCPFGCYTDLWTMGINGSNPQLLKTRSGHPSWVASVTTGPTPTATRTATSTATRTATATPTRTTTPILPPSSGFNSKMYLPILKH